MNNIKSFKSQLALALIAIGLFACAVVAQGPIPPKSAGNVKVKYDKGKDRTTVSLKSSTITTIGQEKATASNLPLHQMDFEAWFTYSGETPGKPVEEAVFRFHCVAGTYIFLKGQEVLVAVDRLVPGKDRGFSLGMTGYKSTAPKFNSVYEEFLDVKVPTDAIKKIGSAETVEFYLGPIPYKFTPKQMESFRQFSQYLP